MLHQQCSDSGEKLRLEIWYAQATVPAPARLWAQLQPQTSNGSNMHTAFQQKQASLPAAALADATLLAMPLTCVPGSSAPGEVRSPMPGNCRKWPLRSR